MREIIENIKEIIKSFIRSGERQVTISFYRLKRKIFRFAFEFLMFSISILFILAGIVIILDKYFDIAWILLITGLLILNFIFMTAKFR